MRYPSPVQTDSTSSRRLLFHHGMVSHLARRIFDAFEQASANVTRQFGGLVLGLAVSKALVELHLGKIRAESAGPGHRSTFIVDLPCESSQ